jgi:AcrR family transcriptional regulator
MVGATAAPIRPYRGQAPQDRLAARRERLLDAALELLGGEDQAGASVRGVCREAGLSPRYFYESFADLEALHAAVLDRIVSEASAVVLAAVAAEPGADFHSKARAAIESFVRYLTDDPRRVRVAAVEAHGSEALQRCRRGGTRLLARMLAGQEPDCYGTSDDLDPLAEVTAGMLVGGMANVIVTWLDGEIDLDRERLVEDLTELFVSTGDGAAAIARRRREAEAQ